MSLTIPLFVLVLSCIALALANLNGDDDSVYRGVLDISKNLRNGNSGDDKHKNINTSRTSRMDKGNKISEILSRFDKMRDSFRPHKNLDFTADKIPELVIETVAAHKLFGYGYGTVETTYAYGSGWQSHKNNPTGTFDSPADLGISIPIPYQAPRSASTRFYTPKITPDFSDPLSSPRAHKDIKLEVARKEIQRDFTQFSDRNYNKNEYGKSPHNINHKVNDEGDYDPHGENEYNLHGEFDNSPRDADEHKFEYFNDYNQNNNWDQASNREDKTLEES